MGLVLNLTEKNLLQEFITGLTYMVVLSREQL